MNKTQSEYYITKDCSFEEYQYLKNNGNQNIECQDKIIIKSSQIISVQKIDTRSNQSEIANQNILIWVDRNISNLENQQYRKYFQLQYGKYFYGFNDESKGLQKIKENMKSNITLISSAQSTYQLEKLLKNTNINILIFCFNKAAHYQLFLRTKQIKAICDRFDKVDSLQQKVMSESQIKNQLQHLVSAPIILKYQEYQHSKYHLSIQFALVIQQLNSQLSLSEEILFDEFSNLLKKNNLQNKIQNAFQQINKTRKAAEAYRKKQLTLFEIFIIMYAGDYYKYINQEFAKRNYNDIKCIMATIFNGYKKQETLNFKELYRGFVIHQDEREISLVEKDFNDLKKALEQSLKNKSSLTWNNLTSTSIDKDVVTEIFIRDQLYSFIFTIYLNNESPHPHYKIPKELAKYPSEEEVLLFPQFEFIVENLKEDGKRKQLIVTLRQVNNKFYYIFDKEKREEYWENAFKSKVYPQLDELISIIYIRFEQLISLLSDIGINSENQKLLQDEECYCIERMNDLVSLFEENSIIKKKFKIVLKVLQTEVQKSKQNYEDLNYVKKIKEFVSQHCSQTLGTQEIKEEQISQFVTQSYQQIVEKVSSKCNELINVKCNELIDVKKLVKMVWNNPLPPIFGNIMKNMQNQYAFKLKGKPFGDSIGKFSQFNSKQCIPLIIYCPPECNCQDRSPCQWSHAQCGYAKLYIDNEGYVSCEKQCSKVFINQLNFVCEKQYNRFMCVQDFVLSLAQPMNALGPEECLDFVMQLQMTIMNKWR